MIPNIDFRTIRPWKGSQNSGFEELCCQLYSLEAPEGGGEFFRKEGAGGDAGVECLWTLANGQVQGLQSKYFINELGASQWSQVDGSVRTALNKYPTLSRYTVCLPVDLTDRRVPGEASQRDVWDAHVAKWTGWAAAINMSVDFVFVGASELGERLTRDDARYSGRTLYWFGTRLLTSDWFKTKFDIARADLGRRYTPEVNVELPIAAVFDGLCRTPSLTDALRRVQTRIRQQDDRLGSALRSLEQDTAFVFDLAALRGNLSNLDSMLGAPLPAAADNIPTAGAIANAAAASEQLSALRHYLEDWSPVKPESLASPSGRPLDDARYLIHRLDTELDEALTVLQSRQLTAANSGALLIDGDAGMGKSHLLADVADAHLACDWPTLLLLGQHLRDGNPWDTFLSDLDLKSYSIDQVLGALDSAGQAAGVRALVLVDAINEGGGRNVWRDRIAGFLASFMSFPHVAVALSCRTTYVDSIVPEGLAPESLTRVTHHGFEGHESEAAAIYLMHYGISRPNTPLLSPEFSNPLFVKTCCEALSRRGERSFPKGVRGVKSMFALYLDSIDSVLQLRMDIDPKEHVGSKAIQRLAKAMAAAGSGALTRDVANQLCNEVHQAAAFSSSLLHHLIAEGALAEDLEYSELHEDEPRDVVRFTFERFSDHFIAEGLLEEHAKTDIAGALAPDAPLTALLGGPDGWRLGGVVEAMAVQIPERYGRELIELAEERFPQFDLEAGFFKSVIWREPTACTDETAGWLSRLGGTGDGEGLWSTVLQVAVEPDHPFNADRLHRFLLSMPLPIRDEHWSIYLAHSYWNASDGEPETITRTLVRWAWDQDSAGADDETARLCGVTLTWFFTTSNRELRDQATKALVALLAVRPQLAAGLLEMFSAVDDPYVLERLYGAVYGAVLQGVPNALLTAIALDVYDRVFRDGAPPVHVLLRDYARGIVELAAHNGCLSHEVDVAKCRPPYQSGNWPLDIPTKEEAEDRSAYDSIRSSVMSMGDFGRYVMGDNSEWSSTELSAARAETHQDRVDAFAARVAADPNPAVAGAFDHLNRTATPPANADPQVKVLLHLVQRLDRSETLKDMPGRKELEGWGKAVADAEAAFLTILPEDERTYFQEQV